MGETITITDSVLISFSIMGDTITIKVLISFSITGDTITIKDMVLIEIIIINLERNNYNKSFSTNRNYYYQSWVKQLQ